MTENKPNFVIKGTNSEGNFVIVPVRFFVTASSPKFKKVVIIGKVDEGQVNTGDQIIIEFENRENSIADVVKEIQRDRKTIPYAVKNEPIGICLSNTEIKFLRELTVPRAGLVTESEADGTSYHKSLNQ